MILPPALKALGLSFACGPTFLTTSTAFSIGFFLSPSALLILSLPLRKGQAGRGERKRMNLVISVEPSLAKPMVAIFEFSPTEVCTF